MNLMYCQGQSYIHNDNNPTVQLVSFTLYSYTFSAGSISLLKWQQDYTFMQCAGSVPPSPLTMQ